VFSPLETGFRPSRYLVATVAVSHLLILFSLFLADLPSLLRLLLLAISLISLVYQLNRCRMNFPDAILALRWDADKKQLHLFMRDSGWLRVERIKSAVALPWAVVMQLELKQRYFLQSLVVMRDATDADSFRRLQVMANYGDYVEPTDECATGS